MSKTPHPIPVQTPPSNTMDAFHTETSIDPDITITTVNDAIFPLFSLNLTLVTLLLKIKSTNPKFHGHLGKSPSQIIR